MLKDPLFGLVDPHNETYWDTEVAVSGRPIRVDLNVDDPNLPTERVAASLTRLADVAALTQAAREAIAPLSRSDPDDPLQLYFEHHRDELSAEALARALGLGDVAKLSVETLVAGLELQRVGVYPENTEETFVVDFGLPRRITNYLLSVKLDADGNPTAVDMES